MTRPLKIELSEEAYRTLERWAAQSGMSPAELAAEALESQIIVLAPPLTDTERRRAIEQLSVHFGAVSLGYPTGTDNESIDADLARSYGDSHEDR